MQARRILVRLGKTLGVLAILAWSLFPIVFLVLSSFKPSSDIFATGSRWLFVPTLEHYSDLWREWPVFFKGLLNSVIVTAGATALAVVASTGAGYVYARHSNRMLEASLAYLIVVRLIPPIVVTLPLFPIVNNLGLADTHFVLILLYATFFVSLGTVLMKTFIDQVPRELDEAAAIDGASPPRILWRVIVPLVTPGLIAVGVFVVVFAWNDFLFAFIFTSTKSKTAPLAIAEMIGAIEGVDWGVLFAASTVQLIPVLLFVMAMNRYLVAGLTAGATKG